MEPPIPVDLSGMSDGIWDERYADHVTLSGAEWLASAAPSPASVQARWAAGPTEPAVLPCGSVTCCQESAAAGSTTITSPCPGSRAGGAMPCLRRRLPSLDQPAHAKSAPAGADGRGGWTKIRAMRGYEKSLAF